jgi:hypothetical protein
MAAPGTTRRQLLRGIALALLLIAIAWSVTKKRPPSGTSTAADTVHEAGHRRNPALGGPNDDGAKTPAPAESPRSDPSVDAAIRKSLEEFHDNRDPEKALLILQQLREKIRQAPEQASAAAVLAFLQTGADSQTGLPFVVGPDGMMESIPTLRLALLDLLPSLDPLSALAVARDLMDRRTSADEYALSLRNLAWNDLDGDLRGELSARFLALLNSTWLAQPSAGLLESFDVAVEIGGGEMFDRLISVARDSATSSNTAASQAAYISLDRMIVRDRSLLAAAFSKVTTWMDFAPQQRASLLSRLDITQPEQKEVFVRYLSATPHPAGELDYFAKIFPNGNYLYGNRLITASESTPGIAEVMESDARVLGELETLPASLSDDASATVRKIRERLAKPTGGSPLSADDARETGR